MKKKPTSLSDVNPGVLVGRFPEGTVGPRLAVNDVGKTVVWSIPKGPDAGLYALEVSLDGHAEGARKIASALEGLRSLELVSLQDGGTLVLLLRRVGAQEYVSALALRPHGESNGVPEVVVETGAEILWFEALETPKGPWLLWAETSRDGADLFARPWVSSDDGAERPAPRRVAANASAWQVAQFRDSAHLVTIEGSSVARKLVLRRLEGSNIAEEKTLDHRFAGGLDLDMAASRDQLVVAYSTKGGFESRLRRVVVDRTGKAGAPAPLTPPRGDQSLVRVFASPSTEGVWFAWEEPARRPERGRAVFLGRLDARGLVPAPESSLALHGQDPLLPLFAATPSGLSMITEAPRCAAPERCAEAPLERLVVRTAPDGGDVQARALEVTDELVVPASMVWDLTCSLRGCFALAAGRGSDTLVRLLDLNEGLAVVPPLAPVRKEVSPRVVAQEIVGEVPELSSLRGVSDAQGALLSWVSYFDDNLPYDTPTRPAPDGRMAPVRAILETERVSDVVTPPATSPEMKVTSEQILSYRARSWAGVGLAAARLSTTSATPAPGASSSHLVAWAALDGKIPQLFLTLVDGSGKKLLQKMHKHPDGEVTDVVAAATSQGFVVAWVDGRGGSTRIYAAAFDRELKLIGQEHELTSSSHEPTELTLLRLGQRVLLVWSDSLGAARTGHGDLHAISLDESAAPVSAERRVAPSELHSHSPSIVAWGSRGDTALLGWLESEPNATGSGSSSLFLTEVDAEGRIVTAATEVSLPGHARGFSASCGEELCRIVASLDRGDRGELWGLGFSGRGAPTLRPLAVLEGPASQSIAPLLLGDHVFFVDPSKTGVPLLRRITLEF